MEHSKIIQQQFPVIFNYDIIFTHGVFDPANTSLVHVIEKEPFFQQPKIAVVIDDGVVRGNAGFINDIIDYLRHHKYAVDNSNILVLPGGEAIKNNPIYTTHVLDLVNNKKIDRHSYLIAIGGGALLDAAGYAAAIAHRGIRLIRIPTTVLSQNDSGVGVKNSINCFGKKNFLGTFMPPYAVINDAMLLATLSDRDWRSGISEAIKVGLIKDAAFFNWIAENTDKLTGRDMPAMEYLIYRCAQLHTQHIAAGGDPFEKGSSRPLDFGHWAAHKLEQLSNFDITHGEAVAIGIALDAYYSFLSHRIDQGSLNRILECFIRLGFRLTSPVLNEQLPAVLDGLEEFREHLGGQLTVMLLEKIGKGIEVHELDRTLIAASVKHLNSFSHSAARTV